MRSIGPGGRAPGLLAVLVLACAGLVSAQPQGGVALTHVHGLSYSPDGKRLMIPSHHGLAIYENGGWSKATGPQHDYMGFAATAQNLYSSGHPAPGSGLVNPFGLIRSRDGGRTWEKLGLEGESDFHLLAASWRTNAIYVWNSAPNSRMPYVGLHSTSSDGFAWKRASAARLQGAPHALAVHPEDPARVAVATSLGVFFSRDWGESFAAVAVGVEGTSVFFDLDGKHLWYATYGGGEPRLARAPLAGGLPSPSALPPPEGEAVAYIAQNPAKRSEYTIATYGRSVYLSRDGARTWKRIAERGEGKSAGATGAGDLLRVSDVRVSPTVPGQAVGAAYMRLRSEQAATLVAIEADVSARAEFHQMTMTNDVMRMRSLDEIELPAGKAVDLAPGGRHAMLVGLNRPLKAGEQVRITLTVRLRDGRTFRQDLVAPVMRNATHGAHR